MKLIYISPHPVRVSYSNTRVIDYPTQWGNYFSLEDCNTNEVFITNMWEENLEELIRRFGLGDLEVVQFGHLGIIIDKRVPFAWMTKKLHFQGARIYVEQDAINASDYYHWFMQDKG